jgi:outer membrane receptor protein involved in Fe transport
MHPEKLWAQRAISIFTLACSCATAQTVGDSSPARAEPDKTPDPTEVAEVVVTAQKRSQSINDVGLTVSAITSDTLAKEGISTLADVAQSVPSLSFSESPDNTPIFTLRGIGFVESSLASYPTVSVSMDEVPLAFPALTTLAAFDLERIEVLKGPQGILFGQNTTGGAINYIAAKPTSRFDAGGDLSYGRFNRVELDDYVSDPLSDTLRGRDDRAQYYADSSTGRKFGFDADDSYALQSMTNYAGFSNLEFDVFPRLTLKAGARYTEADRIAYNCTFDSGNGNAAAFLAGVSSAVRQAFGQDPTYVPITGSECFEVNAVTHLPQLTPFRSVLNEHNVSWRGGIDYRVTHDLLLYTNISKGYKAGSIPRDYDGVLRAG